MKRPYSHKRNLPRSVWGFGIAIGAVVILGAFRLLIPGAFIALSSPLWNSGSSLTTGIGGVFAGFGDKQKLSAQNKNLEAEIQTLQAQNDVLTTRTQDLTKLLGGQTSTNDTANKGIPAGVLARPPESPYDTLIVAEGQSDGVSLNAQVYSAGGIPLGTIKHVTAHTAQVSLYSSPDRSTDGWAGESRIPMTLVGQGSGSFDATVPKASTISIGDSVYVPGPGALPIGTVVKVDVDPSSPNSVIHIQPLVNLFSVTWVLIRRASS
jgi:cell shape-determining protein MreC